MKKNSLHTVLMRNLLVILCLIAFLFSSTPATKAAIVQTETIKTVAKALFYERAVTATNYSDLNAQVIKSVKHSDTALYHIVSVNNQWHAIIAADDAIYPVLSYNFKKYPRGDFPPAYRAWMENIRAQILHVLRNNLSPDQSVVKEWNYYSNPQKVDRNNVKAVSPLLSSDWSQGPPYNNDCPTSSTSTYSNNHVPVGCVAVAMGQIMNYWQHPTTGTGSNSYSSNYGFEYANFGNTNYDWFNMPNSASTSSPSAEKAAVAELLYHCGVSVNMMYGDSASGAYSSDAATALMNNFNYTGGLSIQSKSSTSNWDLKIKNDIDNGRPIYYTGNKQSGGGHAFVLDGYQGSNNQHYHFNWGWGSYFNNYCYLSSLTPANSSSNYSYNQEAIFGIAPANNLQLSTQTISLAGQANSSQSVSITSTINWTASTPNSWLSVSPGSGSNNGSISITATSANTASTARTGSVTVSGSGLSKTITVSQQPNQSTSSSHWYNPAWDLLNDYYGNTNQVSMYSNPLLADSTMTYISGTNNQQSHVSTNHIGVVCDPYSGFYSNSKNDTSSYVLDSIYVGGFYDIANSSYTDTLIVEIVHNQPATNPSFKNVYIPMTLDTLWFSPPSISGSPTLTGWHAKLTDPNTTVIKRPLTVSDSGNTFHYVDVPNINMNAGEVVGVSITFKPGYSYSFGDTLYNYNTQSAIKNSFRYILYQTDNTSLNPNYFHDPYNDQGRYNHSYAIYNDGRYSNYSNTLLNEIMYPLTSQGNHIGLKLSPDNSTLTVSPNSVSLAQASNSSQTVSVSSNISWTANTTTSWLNVSPASGSNNATLTITATSANNSSTARTGSVTVSGSGLTKTINVSQQAGQMSVSPQNLTLNQAANSSQTVNVTANIPWTSNTSTSWLSVSPSSGSNNATLTITATSANNSSTARTGSVTVSGSGISKTVSVSQQAGQMSVSPQNLTLNHTANSSQTVNVTSNISWTAGTGTSWLSISPSSGSNNSTVTVTATSANTGSTSRTGTVTFIGGSISKTIAVTQQAASLNVNPQSISLGASASAHQSVFVSANISWSATTGTSWLSISPSGGTNNDSITVTATSANSGTSARSGTVTVSGSGINQSITVTQQASQLTVNPQNISLAASANASQTVNINSNLNWTATAGNSWLSVTPSGGSNNGNLTITALSANTTTSARSGTVTVNGNGLSQTINVTQQASQLSLSPQSLTLGNQANAAQTVTLTSNIAWNANSGVYWLDVTPANGSNNASLTITANSANSSSSTRSGSITVTGNGLTETLNVTQEASQLSLSTQSITLAGTANSSQSVNVNSNFSWTAQSPQSWLSIAPASGSNNATISISASSANSGSADRTGSVTVSGNGLSETVNVTQSPDTNTAIQYVDEENTLRIYPNPNYGVFYLSSENIEANELEIIIYSMQGQQIYRKLLSTSSGKINTRIAPGHLASGMYYLDVRGEEMHIRKKVIVY